MGETLFLGTTCAHNGPDSPSVRDYTLTPAADGRGLPFVGNGCLSESKWIECLGEGLYPQRPVALLGIQTNPLVYFFICISLLGAARCRELSAPRETRTPPRERGRPPGNADAQGGFAKRIDHFGIGIGVFVNSEPICPNTRFTRDA